MHQKWRGARAGRYGSDLESRKLKANALEMLYQIMSSACPVHRDMRALLSK
ncbi:hypothetical protein [Comamonas guangdongensis]|uniref:hypothetical protein n=1 Tax=Comamonas guangdongensis TaxID=510515 RepID=UPI0034E2A753